MKQQASKQAADYFSEKRYIDFTLQLPFLTNAGRSAFAITASLRTTLPYLTYALYVMNVQKHEYFFF